MASLNWIGKKDIKNHHNHVEYRTIKCVEDVGEPDSGNLILKGDNLLALKALLPYYGGKAKMVYIDPPYNTGNEGWQYNDNVNSKIINKWFENKTPIDKDDLSRHDKWLCMIYPRLKLLQQFLDEDGFICVQIDDSETANLKTLLDNMFGSVNHVITYYIQVRYPNKTLKEDMEYNKLIEQVHVYQVSVKSKANRQTSLKTMDKYIFYFEENQPPIHTIELGGKRVDIFAKGTYEIKKDEPSEKGRKEIWASGSVLDGNSSGRFFRDYLAGLEKKYGYSLLYKVYDIGDDNFDFRYFTSPNKPTAVRGKYFQGIPINQLKSGAESNVPIQNFWDFSPAFGNCNKEGGVLFKSGKKPEEFLKMLIETYSNEGDLIIDSFGGSGSTAATGHKLNRQWVTIEMEEHAQTHILQRLKNVVNGDKTGISDLVNWKGGGGFQYCELSEPLFDEYSLLNENISFNVLAKHLYFTEFGIALKENIITKEINYVGRFKNTELFLYLDDNFGLSNLGDILQKPADQYIVFTDTWTVSDEILLENNVLVKRLPFEIKGV